MRTLTRILSVVSALFVASAAARADDFDVRDAAEFEKVVAKDAKVEKLADGFKFVEGPVWIPADGGGPGLPGGALLFSDIPANQILKWSKADGAKTFREPSNHSNGNTLDREGRLITCEHMTRRVTRTDKDGKVETIAYQHAGKKLNAPNDAVVRSDGSVYFTDPAYGGHRDLEQDKNYIFRIPPLNGEVTPVGTVAESPNGLCFSPDESKLYVADSGKGNITVFELKEDGTLGEGKPFATTDKGAPDGIRCDADGRVWSSAGDGVQVFMPDGKLIGKILIPETAANLCFGGEDGKTLFVTAKTGLYAVQTNVTAAPRPAAQAKPVAP